MTEASRPATRFLARGLTILVLATWVLIVLGALVRAHGAGLACPDWPLCSGRLVPAFDLRVALEWTHRLLAGTLTLALAALTFLARRAAGQCPALLRPLGIAWGLLGAQIVLGGLTVLLRLAPWTVTAHLVVGNSFCLALLWAARNLSELEPAGLPAPARGSALLLGTCAALLGAQMVLGGMVSSHGAGLACPRFPTCDGESLVPALTGPVGLHLLHRAVGVALLASFLVLARATRGAGRAGVLARAAARLAVLQVALGAANVLLRLPVEVTGLHSACATALVLVTGLVVRERVRGGAGLPVSVSSEKARGLS